MINETINETVNQTAQITVESLRQNPVTVRFIELITAPLNNSEMMWIVTPLLITLFVMQLYFGRYKKEKLSWDSATGNALALMFVAADLGRRLFLTIPVLTFETIFIDHFYRVLVILIVAIGALWLMVGDFFHLLPEKIAMWVSSSLPINMIAYVSIVIIYTDVPVDGDTLLASAGLLIVLWIFFQIVKFFEPIALPEKVKKKD